VLCVAQADAIAGSGFSVDPVRIAVGFDQLGLSDFAWSAPQLRLVHNPMFIAQKLSYAALET
jgi:hypothetical protein